MTGLCEHLWTRLLTRAAQCVRNRAARDSKRVVACLTLAIAILAHAQDSPKPPPANNESTDLTKAIQEAGNSPVDLTRSLEAFLAKYPEAAQRNQIMLILARAAIDLKDDQRVVKYGEQALAGAPDDMLILDREIGRAHV